VETNSGKTRVSRRVSPHKIRRLYESDARGMLDEELLDDVGYGIYARCQDIIELSEAGRGKVKCWNCGNIIMRKQGRRVTFVGHGTALLGGEEEVLKCGKCSWQITWGDYGKSWSGKRLDDGGAVHILESFVRQWPSTRSPSAKLRLIDDLIHEFHVVQEGCLGAPLAVNVIQGTARDVAELINDLAYGTGSTTGLQETRNSWLSIYVFMGKSRRFTKSVLQEIARELGIKGFSRMRKAELIEAIERMDPERLESDQKGG
jgi:hypothetical protein